MLLNIIVSERFKEEYIGTEMQFEIIIMKCASINGIGSQLILQFMFLIAIIYKIATTTFLGKLLNLTQFFSSEITV